MSSFIWEESFISHLLAPPVSLRLIWVDVTSSTVDPRHYYKGCSQFRYPHFGVIFLRFDRLINEPERYRSGHTNDTNASNYRNSLTILMFPLIILFDWCFIAWQHVKDEGIHSRQKSGGARLRPYTNCISPFLITAPLMRKFEKKVKDPVSLIDPTEAPAEPTSCCRPTSF